MERPVKWKEFFNKTMIVRFFVKPVFYPCLLLSFFLLSCASTRYPRGGSVNVPDDFFGMVHAGHSQSHEEYELLDDLGVKWVLTTLYWGSVERHKGNFDFSRYDKYVETAKKEGKKIVIVLAYEAPWLYPDGESKKYISPENIPHFLRFVEETVKRYQGRVDVWNIWNEPNWKFWKGSKKDYYELSRRSAQKIRETDPDAYILGGGFLRVPKRFIKKMNRAGGMENLDGLAFHPYALHPEGSMRLHDKFTRVVSDINFTGEAWITEIGHPTGGRYPHKVSLEGLPSHVVKSMTGAAARGTRAALWYELFDHHNKNDVPPKTTDSEKFFGLVYPDFSRKNGANAYELCAKFLPGSRYVPDFLQREKIPSSIISFCFLEGTSGNNTLVVWNDKKRTKKVKLYLDAPAVLYDVTTGKGQPLSAETILEIGKQPQMITWQGTHVPRLSTTK